MALSSCNSICATIHCFSRTQQNPPWKNSFLQRPLNFRHCRHHLQLFSAINDVLEVGNVEGNEQGKPRFRWREIGPDDVTEEQKQTIAELPFKMINRCKALMKQIICFNQERCSLSLLLGTWVKSMKPQRADWLSVLKELDRLDHPLYFQVAELGFLEASFEANVRDYTKIIHHYAKQNRIQEAEQTFLAMKNRGYVCDQVALTALVHMYSKAGNLKLAEDTFREMKSLGVPLDRRSYGSMIMAYVRAGKLDLGESLLREMEAQYVYAGREVYKAILRAYAMAGDSQGAQRIFNAIQLAAIVPDAKLCGLLMNAYSLAGQHREARIAFHNLRRAGLAPNDKCVALVLAAYEKENKLNEALDVLLDLERDGVVLGEEALEILAGWFKRLGVDQEVELVLRDHALAAAGITGS